MGTRPTERRDARQLALVAFAVAALAALFLLAGRAGLSDVARVQAEREMRQWSAAAGEPEAAQWRSARESIERGLAWVQGDPNLFELAAKLHYGFDPRGEPNYVERHELALQYLERALVLRPASPYAWANLALVRYRLGRDPASVMAAARNAAMLGPWEPEVGFAIADAGLALWDELPAPDQAMVGGAIARASRRAPVEVLRIAEKRGRLATSCQFIGKPEQNHGLASDTSKQVGARTWQSLCESGGTK
jgi:tetratricopeptide (TPR) repeat protein